MYVNLFFVTNIKMKFLFLVTVFVMFTTESSARPVESDELSSSENEIEGVSDRVTAYKFPTTIRPGYSIIVHGILDGQSKKITVLLPAADGDGCEIVYDYSQEIMRVKPALDPYDQAEYELHDKSSPFTLGLTARLDQSKNKEFNVSFTVNGADLPSPLVLSVKSFESFGTIIMKEGIKKVTNLSFSFT